MRNLIAMALYKDHESQKQIIVQVITYTCSEGVSTLHVFLFVCM